MNDTTLRDQFATAALTGLLAAPTDKDRTMEYWARFAYESADAMLQERAKCTKRDTPQSYSPTTEKRGDSHTDGACCGTSSESDWHGDIRPPDDFDRAIAAATDEAWGINDETPTTAPAADGTDWPTSGAAVAWIPVTERMPEEGRLVLWYRQDERCPVTTGSFERPHHVDEGGDLCVPFSEGRYTHWMPLPAPPTDAK